MFTYVLDQKGTKLEPKTVKMIFIGYSDHHKAYKFIHRETDKVVISRNARLMMPAQKRQPILKLSSRDSRQN